MRILFILTVALSLTGCGSAKLVTLEKDFWLDADPSGGGLFYCKANNEAGKEADPVCFQAEKRYNDPRPNKGVH